MFETLPPGVVACLRKVDLLPALDDGLAGVFSFARLDIFDLPDLPPTGVGEIILALGGEEGRPNLTSLPRPLRERFSGEGRREELRDSGGGPTGPGMRLPV